MIIETSYPGQEIRTVDAPPHIVEHLEKFGSLPPFIKLVSISGTTLFEDKPSAWINPDSNAEHKVCGAHHEGWMPAYCRRS